MSALEEYRSWRADPRFYPCLGTMLAEIAIAELEAALEERDGMLDFVNPWRRQENKDKWLARIRSRIQGKKP